MKTPDTNYHVMTRRILLTVILVLVSLASYAYVIVSYFNSIDIHIKKIAESSLISTSKDVTKWVEQKRDMIDLIGKGIGTFTSQQPELIQGMLSQLKENDPGFIDIFFATALSPDENGFAVYATDWEIPQDYDWTTRAWFNLAVKNGSISITPPYKDLQTGKTIISISKPVVIDGVLFGVLSSDISVDVIFEIINDVYTAKSSVSRLFDSEGLRISLDSSTYYEDEITEIELSKEEKTKILAGMFYIETHTLADRYEAYIGLPYLGWILSSDGSLSSFEDVQATVLRFSVILLFLAALFIFMLLRTWRTNSKLEIATDVIEQANRDLENRVNERTASLRNLLDNAEEGFFTFSNSMTVNPDYSKGCEDIFGMEISGLSVADVLFPGRTETINDFKQGFELFFSGKSKADIIFDLTEKQTTIKGRIISIKYKETTEQRILCILNDITLELEVAEKNKKEAEDHQRILRAINNKHFFVQYLESADSLFSRLELYIQQEPTEEEKIKLMRRIHTFKGDSGFFGFIETQAISHETETLITDSTTLETKISYKEILIQIRKAYYKELKSITDTMGEDWVEDSNGVMIPRPDYKKLLLYVKKKFPADKQLQNFLDSFKKISLTELFSRLPFAAQVTAEKLGKKIKPMQIIGGTFKVVPDRYYPLVDSCIHIVNNMVDHGIEYPYERESLQKPQEGTIELLINVDKNQIILEFRDDGRGINAKTIENIARKQGLIEENRSLQNSELYALIFEDKFTTRNEASDTSGRGIGLAAVKASVNDLKGYIEVKTKLGKGTTFKIIIPLSNR